MVPISSEMALQDYRFAYRSRQVSLLARQEVLNGRAKFGGFGDGKELPLVAMARFFEPGDFRSGYYRGQTLMLASGMMTVEQYFAQLYAHANLQNEPNSGGRQMPSHFATHLLDEHGRWRDLTAQKNTASDMSPTAAQMPRLVGLAYASKVYRHVEVLQGTTQFSKNGNEVAFGEIGNASTAEGIFWEAVNAIGVLQAPAVLTILDDGYGISVPNEHQFFKESISEQLAGFGRTETQRGFNLYQVKGWDYAALLEVYADAVRQARQDHIPAIIHATQLTQPQGHSTSGSHERYKSAERLAWEAAHDCVTRMRHWLLREEHASEQMIAQLEAEEETAVHQKMRSAWQAYKSEINQELTHGAKLLNDVADQSTHSAQIKQWIRQMNREAVPRRRPLVETIFKTFKQTRDENLPAKDHLRQWRDAQVAKYQALYSDHLVSSCTDTEPILPVYAADAPEVAGYEILNQYFDGLLARDPRVVAFGEDVGFLGGVNQAFAGLQAKYGDLRVSDTGIRESTIIGQGIGLALRGLRPIAEIQYLDYVPYAIQIMTDDLATLHWRTAGRQIAPVIVRTRGHRLEGIWHSGSLMAAIIHAVRGMHVVVPRNMTQAVGFYNALLQGTDPAILVEVLLAYRQKERLPDNLVDITFLLGVPEILREGNDVTAVTYGAMCGVVMQAADALAEVGIALEVIDIQTLLPFDTPGVIGKSLKKTNRILFTDEDVPGGTTAYMMQEVLERQGGYEWLDSAPVTLSATAHRPPYGTDGGYFSKPSVESVFTAVYDIMHEANPAKYPPFQ